MKFHFNIWCNLYICSLCPYEVWDRCFHGEQTNSLSLLWFSLIRLVISCIKIFIKIHKSILLWTPLVECHYMAQTDDCITSFPSCPDKNKYSVSLSLLSFFFATLLSLFLKRPSHSLSCAAYVPRVLCLLFPFPLFFQPLNHILFKSYNETLHLL